MKPPAPPPAGQSSIFDLTDDPGHHDDEGAWWATAWGAAVDEATSGRVFTAYELRTRHGVPDPANLNRWGALFHRLHADGVIERYGYAPSFRPTTRGSAASRWRGSARYRTEAST